MPNIFLMTMKSTKPKYSVNLNRKWVGGRFTKTGTI